MIISFLLHIIANAIAVLASGRFVSNVFYQYDFFSLIKIAFMLSVVNALLKPVLKTIFSPLILITLGFFTLVINMFLVWVVTRFAPEFSVNGFVAYFWTTAIVSFFNFIVSATQKNKI